LPREVVLLPLAAIVLACGGPQEIEVILSETCSDGNSYVADCNRFPRSRSGLWSSSSCSAS